jgi:7-cyano-7-deazaguanine reductase
MNQKSETNARTELLEIFDNDYPDRAYTIEIVCPEFTSVCPKTGQPDFGTICVEYIPAKHCIELKSLKLYLQQFRNEGIFYENLTNQILDDLVSASHPVHMKILSQWRPRGGISTDITVHYDRDEHSRSG